MKSVLKQSRKVIGLKVTCLMSLYFKSEEDTVVNFFLVEAETRRRWDIFQAEVALY